MIEAFASRSGPLALKIGGRALHSPYDPELEARRFVAESLRGEPPGTIVILGEGLGYAAREAGRQFPAARLITICYSAEVDRLAAHRAPSAWSPSAGGPLVDFLRTAVAEPEVEGLRVVEWPASARLFPEESRQANLAVREVVRELNGSCATTAAMGRLWLRNSIANFVALEEVRVGSPCHPGRPVVIAASGPGLRAALPALRRLRAAFDLWALPSAVPALDGEGIAADLVALTDAGHWAMLHLRFQRTPGLLAMPLSAARAARGAARAPAGVFLLAQSASFERELLAAARVEPPRVDPHGTVAATALDLALGSTSGPVVLAGLDLCADDILTHALPNAFDDLLAGAETRLQPRYTAWYARARAGEASSSTASGRRVRVSRALETYAGWLGGRIRAAGGRVYRLFPSRIELPGATPIDEAGLGRLLDGQPASVPGPVTSREPGWPARAARISLASRLLGQWEQAIAAANPSVADLAWNLGTRQLIEARRRGRLGDARGAREIAAEMACDAAAFLRGVRERVETA